jgi:hypothetical protein
MISDLLPALIFVAVMVALALAFLMFVEPGK